MTREITNSDTVTGVDRSSVSSFLSGGSTNGEFHAHQGDEIVGVSDLAAAEKNTRDHESLSKGTRSFAYWYRGKTGSPLQFRCSS